MQPDLVLFSGQGESDGFLVRDSRGLPTLANPVTLGRRIRDAGFRGVIFSACYDREYSRRTAEASGVSVMSVRGKIMNGSVVNAPKRDNFRTFFAELAWVSLSRERGRSGAQ